MENLERMALILVEAELFGSTKASEKWGIHRNTVYNYRQALQENEALFNAYQLQKDKMLCNWADEIPAAVIACISFLRKAAEEADHTNPQVIEAISKALATLAEIGITKEMIDIRLGIASKSSIVGLRSIPSRMEESEGEW